MRRFLLLTAAAMAAVIVYFVLQPVSRVPERLLHTAADPATFMSPGAIRTVHAYATVHYIFAFAHPLVVLLVMGWLYQSRIPARWLADPRKRIHGRAFAATVLTMAAAASAAGLTLDGIHFATLQRLGGIDRDFGSWWLARFNETGWIPLAEIGLAAVVGRFLIRRRPRWWITLWLLGLPLIAFYEFAQPALLLPHQSPEGYAIPSRFPDQFSPMYVMPVSDRTTALNAYSTGIGSSARIVIWDTCLQVLDKPELRILIGHELGHLAHGDVYWGALEGTVATLALVLAVHGAWKRVCARGERDPVRHLPLIALWISLLALAWQPVDSALQRVKETRADRYSVQQVGDRTAAIHLFQAFAVRNGNEMNPPWLYQFFYGKHPALMTRIDDAMQEREEEGRMHRNALETTEPAGRGFLP